MNNLPVDRLPGAGTLAGIVSLLRGLPRWSVFDFGEVGLLKIVLEFKFFREELDKQKHFRTVLLE